MFSMQKLHHALFFIYMLENTILLAPKKPKRQKFLDLGPEAKKERQRGCRYYYFYYYYY